MEYARFGIYMKTSLSVIFLAVALLFAGCATELSHQGSLVKVATGEEVKGCEYLGVVEASSSLTGMAREAGFRNALNEAMNKAAALGATHIVLDERSKPRYWTTSIIVRAEAYRK